MAQKSVYIDIIQDWFDNSADYQNKFHPYDIQEFINAAWSKLIYNVCVSVSKNQDWSQLDPFIKSYNVPVRCDTERDEYFSILPVSVVGLPGNRGVYRISPVKNNKLQFQFRDSGTNDIYGDSEWSKINNIPSYYQEANMIFFNEKMTVDMAEAGVVMKIIPEFSVYEDEDEIPMPSGSEQDLIQIIIKELAPKLTPDSKSNSFPDTIQQPKN